MTHIDPVTYNTYNMKVVLKDLIKLIKILNLLSEIM